MTTTQTPDHRRIWGRTFCWVLIVLSVLFLTVIAWVGHRAFAAQQHLTAAQNLAEEVSSTVASDPASANAVVNDLAFEVAAAQQLMDDPLWAFARTFPWIGPQLSAASTVVDALDSALRGAVMPLTDAALGGGLSTLTPQSGHVDLAAVAALSGSAHAAESTLDDASREVQAIDSAPLLTVVRAGVDDVRLMLDNLTATAGALANATELLPTMLGADGPREYLVLFQNNAEWRSLGGIPGAMLTLRTHDGRIELGTQASTSDFPHLEQSIAPLDEEMSTIFGPHPGRWMQNVTQVPEFTTAATLANTFWQRDIGTELDGVIAVDPVALSYLLEATGPIELPSGDTISSENAVSLLLNEVYFRYPSPTEQDAFFAMASATVFERLLDDVDAAKLLPALMRIGEDRRLLVWSADPAEQAVLDGTTLQGGLPESDDETSRFGIYLNDSTGSKLDYYMRAGAAAQVCGADATGGTRATVRVELRNDAPADAATALPNYIVGANGDTSSVGLPRAVSRTLVYAYLPEGATLDSAEGEDATTVGMHDGRLVVSWYSDLAPGESAHVDLQVSLATGSTLETLMTPVAPISTLETRAACTAP